MTGSMTDAVGLYRFKHIGTERTSGWLKFREHAHEFGSLFDRMLQECQQARLGFQSMLLAMLLELLILLERRLAGGGESDIQASPDDRMDTIVHYIRARLHEPITLRDVSAQIKLGERQLQRLIQAATGLTFTGLLHKERIDRSCALLKHTAKTAAEIASLAGFHDMKHFHRLFKQLTGMTPVAFRKEAAAAEPPKPDYSS
jgi:AraC family L-rhamnose operon transcriptional activator RhaR